jgi:hypothetical protein
MMTRKPGIAAIAILTGLLAQQCAPGFGNGSQTQRANAATATGVLSGRQAVAIRHLKFPQSGEAMARRFGPPAAVSRSQTSSSYTQHYADRVQPVSVVYRWDGVAIGLAGEGQ